MNDIHVHKNSNPVATYLLLLVGAIAAVLVALIIIWI